MYRPGEWEQLPSEQDLNPFSRYEALDPKRPIVLDDIESTLSETGKMVSFSAAVCDPIPQMVVNLPYVFLTLIYYPATVETTDLACFFFLFCFFSSC